MLAVLRYECPCGKLFLVDRRPSGEAGTWPDVVRQVAARLGAEYVDEGRRRGFACGCGRLHARPRLASRVQ